MGLFQRMEIQCRKFRAVVQEINKATTAKLNLVQKQQVNESNLRAIDFIFSALAI